MTFGDDKAFKKTLPFCAYFITPTRKVKVFFTAISLYHGFSEKSSHFFINLLVFNNS